MTDLPTSPDALLARLAALGIDAPTVAHEPVFTVEESQTLRGPGAALAGPGGHCKSLFLKDKKGQLWLVVCLEDRRLDMKALQPLIGSARLSFGRPDLLFEVLGVRPGSVTPFSLVNDTGCRVRVVLDAAMLQLAPLHYHPLQNDRTTRIAPDDLLRFIAACGHRPLIVDLDAAGGRD
ncbi:MAG: prolyl-tRNA synthetase associated domain-containing protein [Sneathiellaceae bacterium]